MFLRTQYNAVKRKIVPQKLNPADVARWLAVIINRNEIKKSILPAMNFLFKKTYVSITVSGIFLESYLHCGSFLACKFGKLGLTVLLCMLLVIDKFCSCALHGYMRDWNIVFAKTWPDTPPSCSAIAKAGVVPLLTYLALLP